MYWESRIQICYREKGNQEVIKVGNEKKKKKGLLSVIRKSMTKTGGCCGPGETCGGLAKQDDKKTSEDKDTEGSETKNN